MLYSLQLLSEENPKENFNKARNLDSVKTSKAAHIHHSFGWSYI